MAGERGHQAGDTCDAEARYSLMLLDVEGKGVGGKCQPSAHDSGLGWEHFNVPSVSSLLVPQKVSERSITWLAFELAFLHEPWNRKGRW